MDSKTRTIFYWLVWASLLTPVVYLRALEYPFVTTKALFFQTLVELALPFYLYLIISRKDWRPNLKNPITLAILGYLAVGLVSALAGVNFQQSFWGSAARMTGIFNLAHLVLLYFYILLLGKIDGSLVDKLVRTLVWVATISAAYGTWVWAGLPKLFSESIFGRVASFFGNPIYFASFLVIPIFVTILVATNEESRGWKITYFIFAVLQILGIYVSKTRDAYVGLLAGALVVVLFYLLFAAERKIRNYGLVVLTVAVIGGGFFAVKKVHFTDKDSQARLLQWRVAMKGFKDHPILGTGPENYYVIANKYYNPAIYNYDASWWDKPHNNLLESLVTAGVAGFIFYLGIIGSVLYGFYFAYKKEMLSGMELAILVGALAAYEIQNFFVFDTAAANIVFYFFLGLIVYFVPEAIAAKESKPAHPAWLKPVFAGSMIVTIILAYYANWLPMVAAYYTNKAIRVGNEHPEQAWQYLAQARQASTNAPRLADIGYSAEQYASGAVHDKAADTASLQENLSQSIGLWNSVVGKVNNDPTYWLKLANLYYAQAFLATDKANFEQQAENAVNKAQGLAPNRVEPLWLLAKLKIGEEKIAEAEKILNQAMAVIPQNPNSDWHLKYKQDALSDFDLLIRYYAAKADYQKVLDLYQTEIKIDPNNPELYSGVAATYAKLGDKANAILAAKKVLELKPEAADDVQAFINSLK